MTPQDAIQILARKKAGEWYDASVELAAAVCMESRYGDPDDSLGDWIGNGDYDGSETVESIAAEWDELFED